jgi:hypothetical protein
MRNHEEIIAIYKHWEDKISQVQTGKKLNISRGTIKDYYKLFNSGLTPEDIFQKRKVQSTDFLYESSYRNMIDSLKFLDEKEKAYSYLLGLYLGDGHIIQAKNKRCYKFRIYQDKRYKNLIDFCVKQLNILFDNKNKVAFANKVGCVEIYLYSTILPKLFPQHGPGKKHLRKIELLDWQEKILAKYPKMFIKGLIESDGCRFNATSSKRKYDFKARYQFTNYSLDIQDLFINYCWLLGLNLKRNENKFYKNIYVYKKRDVDFFDTFIGPKS